MNRLLIEDLVSHSARLVEDRRAEYVYGTAAEVMQMMSNLASKAQILRPGGEAEAEAGAAPAANDEMAAAMKAGGK